jgi:hypothetical protein
MAKITYSSLKLKINEEIKKVEGTDIEVLQYLPIEDKNALINISLEQSKQDSIFNPTLLDAFFNLYIVMMYTNITFTEKQKEEPLKIYNALKSNGLLDKIIMAMNEEEYNDLVSKLNQQMKDIYQNQNTFAGVLNNLLANFETQADEIQKLVDGFDKEKFKNVLEYAKSVNNNQLPN